MSTDTCGAHTTDPYYYAYNAFAGLQYQVVALADQLSSTQKSTLAIGGRTTNCKGLAPGPPTCARDVGAFVMFYRDVVDTAPEKLFVASEVTYRGVVVDVTGVLAIEALSTDYKPTVMGVFESPSNKLVVFRSAAHNFAVYAPAIGVPVCEFSPAQFQISDNDKFSIVFSDCRNDDFHWKWL